jgi:hypothetical protein
MRHAPIQVGIAVVLSLGIAGLFPLEGLARGAWGRASSGHSTPRSRGGSADAGEATRRRRMAKRERQGRPVSVEEVLLAQAFQFEALVNILEQRGLLTREEVVAEIKRLHEKAGAVR